MKRFILIPIIFILLINTVSANSMRKINLDIDIDRDAKINAKYIFTDEIEQVNFPCDCDFSDIKIEDGKCEEIKDIKNILICEPESPFMVGIIEINPSFTVKDTIKKQGNVSYFSLDIPVLWDTEEISINVKIPNGMALMDNDNYPLSPSDAKIGSDGRRIIVSWNFENMEKGDVIPIRVYYESMEAGLIGNLNEKWFVVLILAVIITAVIVNRLLSKRSQLVLSVLNENEKMIVDLIKDQHTDKVDQRKLVELSGFSKAKVSRIIQSLEERGLVEREKTGRKNRVCLRKKYFKDM